MERNKFTNDPDTTNQIKSQAIEEEIERLTILYNLIKDHEAQKLGHNFAAAGIPSQEVSDRLLRSESHLSREFDRTLTQLARVQRMRTGQPLPPQIDVKIS